MTEAYVVVIGEKKGKRWAKRLPLNVPVELATGQYEQLSDLQVREARKDLEAEEARRREATAKTAEIQRMTGGWDPFSALRRVA